MTDIQIATGGGMNWTWFLAYSTEDDSIIRHAEDRFHRFDYSQGAELETLLSQEARGINYCVQEAERDDSTTERLAVGITINGLYRPLRQPEPRFIYVPFDWRTKTLR